MKSERMLPGLDRITQALIHHATRRVPGALSERLEEEWLADLVDLKPGFSRLRFAIGCCWATAVIARDQGLMGVAAANTPLAPQGQIIAQNDLPRFSRRTAALLLVAALHVAL